MWSSLAPPIGRVGGDSIRSSETGHNVRAESDETGRPESVRAARTRTGQCTSGRSTLVRNTDSLRLSCRSSSCLLYTSDAADDLLCVDLGGRRIIKKKK